MEMEGRRALITGVFGQDGSYLVEQLTALGVEVHGVLRRRPSARSRAIGRRLASRGFEPRIHHVDLLNPRAVASLVAEVQPDHVFHLAATHRSSQASTDATARSQLFERNIAQTRNLLLAIARHAPMARCVLAGSCMIFDAARATPQSEETPIATSSEYGSAKAEELMLGREYRSEGLHVATAILYNHESPRRPADFVTRKVVVGMMRLRHDPSHVLHLGDLDAVRDWGYAADYANAMLLMAHQDEPTDLVLATGAATTVRTLVALAADSAGASDWQERIRVQSGVVAPRLASVLVGDPSRAELELGWSRTLDLTGLIELMVEEEQRSPWPV